MLEIGQINWILKILPRCELTVDEEICDDVLEVPSLVDTSHQQKEREADCIPSQSNIVGIHLARI